MFESIIITILFSINAILIGIVVWKIFKIFHPRRIAIRRTPSIYEMNYEQFDVITKDNINIEGWLIEKPSSNSSGTIILCHNMGGNKEKMLQYAKFLYDADYRVVLFDFRSHGNSGIDYHLEGGLKRFYMDIEAIVTYLSSRVVNIKDQGLVLQGFSIGTIPAVIFSAQNPLVKVVILDSGPPIDLVDSLARLFKRASNLPTYPFQHIFMSICLLFIAWNYKSTLKRMIQKISPRPIFFIHGDRDTIFPHANTYFIYNMIAKKPKKYWLVENAFHLTAHFSNKQMYEQEILCFLSEHYS